MVSRYITIEAQNKNLLGRSVQQVVYIISVEASGHVEILCTNRTVSNRLQNIMYSAKWSE